jgi:hypothetical protein
VDSISRNLKDSLTKLPQEGVLDDLDRRIGSGRSQLEKERGRRRDGSPSPAATKLADASELGLRGHGLARGRYQMKEGNEAVLTTMKMEAEMIQG